MGLIGLLSDPGHAEWQPGVGVGAPRAGLLRLGQSERVLNHEIEDHLVADRAGYFDTYRRTPVTVGVVVVDPDWVVVPGMV